MEPKEIFDLILKADDALKYATDEKRAARSKQARGFLTQARNEALQIGNQNLAEQAERRLADLDALEKETSQENPGPAAG
jgi:hypothetical protein